jgi:hypothetical protein
MLDLLASELHQVTRVVLHRLFRLMVTVVVKLPLRLLGLYINKGRGNE